jgi:hypothetical protein
VRLVVVAALALCAACSRPPPQDVFDLPLHPNAIHPDAGPVDAGPQGDGGATCATGDGCFVACPFLDADCPDGAVCKANGICASGCAEADPDCSPLDDGLKCTFGEECKSKQCTFILDAGSLCTHPCPCAQGFVCDPRPDTGNLCLPSCASTSLPLCFALLALLRFRGTRAERRCRRRSSVPC